MKKILLIDYQYTTGGPKTVLGNLMHSGLSKTYKFVLITKSGTAGYNPIKAIQFVRYYLKRINQEHADIAYVCGLQYIGFLMTLAAKLSNVKSIVLSVHGSDWDVPEHTLRRAILKYIIEPIEVRLADRIITVCDAERKIARSLNCARKNAYFGTIYNTFPQINYTGVPSGKLRSELHIPYDRIIVSSVGRVTERKGHQYIIEAINRIKDPSFVFVIIGDGDYLEHYRRQCNQALEEHRLYLLGNRNDVYELLKDTDIFLFATLNENHSMALLEAISMHCAIVATCVGGNPEVITNGESGLLIRPKDSDKIVKSLYMLKDGNFRKQLALKAFKNASTKFSEPNTWGKLAKLFDQC